MVSLSRGRNPLGRDTHLLLIYLDRILEAEKVKLQSVILFRISILILLSVSFSQGLVRGWSVPSTLHKACKIKKIFIFRLLDAILWWEKSFYTQNDQWTGKMCFEFNDSYVLKSNLHVLLPRVMICHPCLTYDKAKNSCSSFHATVWEKCTEYFIEDNHIILILWYIFLFSDFELF